MEQNMGFEIDVIDGIGRSYLKVTCFDGKYVLQTTRVNLDKWRGWPRGGPHHDISPATQSGVNAWPVNCDILTKPSGYLVRARLPLCDLQTLIDPPSARSIDAAPQRMPNNDDDVCVPTSTGPGVTVFSVCHFPATVAARLIARFFWNSVFRCGLGFMWLFLVRRIGPPCREAYMSGITREVGAESLSGTEIGSGRGTGAARRVGTGREREVWAGRQKAGGTAEIEMGDTVTWR